MLKPAFIIKITYINFYPSNQNTGEKSEFLKILRALSIYRVRHMSWYGISNGCGKKMAKPTSTKFFKAI